MSKRFETGSRSDLLRAAIPFRAPQPSGVLAIDCVDLEVPAGQCLGIIGRNGAGKSTLLKLAAGVLTPSDGEVRVRGTPASIIELGLSLHPDLTATENLPMLAALFGMAPDEFAAIRDEVVEFSGLREFLDDPVKHFSTGMVARLGFAVASHVPAPVLLVDEVLAVGDRSFQLKCIDRVRKVVAAGAAVLFVSHSLDLVVQVCDRAVRLERGRLVDDGTADDVVGRYARGIARAPAQRSESRIADVRLERDVIASGEMLEATCSIDLVGDTRGLRLRSALVVPSQGAGAINDDELDPGSLSGSGQVQLSASIGPLVTTAGKLQFVVELVREVGDGAADVVDERSCTFRVEGEDIGVIRVVAETSWSIEPASTVEERHVLPAVTGGELLEVRGVAKRFGARATATTSPSLMDHVARTEWALHDVSFDLDRGESVGLIGANGAGKSTLLRILAGVTEASAGAVHLEGRVAAILEVAGGFHGDLTGAENLEFVWRLQGGTSDAWSRAFPRIIEMADIGPVLNQPTKHYSTGMRARLALALVLELGCDLLLIDEALSVGDEEFRTRVAARVAELVADGTTILFATHDLHLLRDLCGRTLRLDAGRLVDDGPTDHVLSNAGGVGWAGGTSSIDGAVVLGALDVTPAQLGWGDPFTVTFEVDVQRPSPNCYLEFSVRETLDPADRRRPRTPAEVMESTVVLHRIGVSADIVATPGRKVVVGQVAGLPVLNLLDVVVSVVDEFDGRVLSEQWRSVYFGAAGPSHARAVVRWQAAHGGPRHGAQAGRAAQD